MLSGEVLQVAELRYTPAGIPLLSLTLRHASEQTEAGMKRKIEYDVPAVAMAQLAEQVKGINVGTIVKVSGFLAKRSLNNRQLVLHLDKLKIIQERFHHGT